jgi:hypothetical protein
MPLFPVGIDRPIQVRSRVQVEAELVVHVARLPVENIVGDTTKRVLIVALGMGWAY